MPQADQSDETWRSITRCRRARLRSASCWRGRKPVPKAAVHPAGTSLFEDRTLSGIHRRSCSRSLRTSRKRADRSRPRTAAVTVASRPPRQHFAGRRACIARGGAGRPHQTNLTVPLLRPVVYTSTTSWTRAVKSARRWVRRQFAPRRRTLSRMATAAATSFLVVRPLQPKARRRTTQRMVGK